MNAEEKTKELQTPEPVESPPRSELEILSPTKYEVFKLGNPDKGQEVREYKIFPPALREMTWVDNLEAITNDSKNYYKRIDELCEVISKLTGEKDLDYIKDVTTQASIMTLLMTITKATTIGLHAIGLKVVSEKKTLNGSGT